MKIWYDIQENDVKRLYNDPRYPDNPDKVKILSSFHTGRQNIADNYGSILSALYQVRHYQKAYMQIYIVCLFWY
jgi:hypothetical protein